MSHSEKDEKTVHHSHTTVTVDTTDYGTRIGLWVGLGTAAVATIGILALAFYTDYQEKKAAQNHTVVVTTEPIQIQHGAILPANEQEAASMALVISETQSNGMTAPADEATPNEMQIQPIINQTSTFITETNPIADNEATVIVENGIVKFYFASGKSELGGDILAALKDIDEGVQNGRKAIISGYTDNTGDTEANERLSKERAFKVRDALIAAGIPAHNIEMQKPQNTTGSGSHHEARRVEVVLQ